MNGDAMNRGRILWSGRPKVVASPTGYRVSALVMALIAAVSTCFAVVVTSALAAPVGSLLAFAAVCATVALCLDRGPAVWRSELEYQVTEGQVIYRRGLFVRRIGRRDVSYARIHWHPKLAGIGDLELVRAVPTGALRRKLTLRLPGIEGPDVVLALIRGRELTPGERVGLPIEKRLDEGERVLWTGRPRASLRQYLPNEPRDFANCGLALFVLVMLFRQVMVAVPVTKQVLAAGISASSLPFIALVAAFGLASLLLAGVAVGVVYVALIRPARRFRRTRYLITNERVLIERPREELSLDRSRIAEIIDMPAKGGVADIFLVLDGPASRAFATSGAFGTKHRKDSLLPVLRATADAEEAIRILRQRPVEHEAPAAARG